MSILNLSIDKVIKPITLKGFKYIDEIIVLD